MSEALQYAGTDYIFITSCTLSHSRLRSPVAEFIDCHISMNSATDFHPNDDNAANVEECFPNYSKMEENEEYDYEEGEGVAAEFMS